MSIADISVMEGPDYDNSVLHGGDGLGLAYTAWDKDLSSVCKCDNNFFAADCSMSKFSFVALVFNCFNFIFLLFLLLGT
jgi:hypothetical protein